MSTPGESSRSGCGEGAWVGLGPQGELPGGSNAPCLANSGAGPRKPPTQALAQWRWWGRRPTGARETGAGPGDRETGTDRLVLACVGRSRCRFRVVQFLKRRGGAHKGRGACAATPGHPQWARPRPGQRRAGVWGCGRDPSGSSRPHSPLPPGAVVSPAPAAGGASDWLRMDGRARIGCPGQGAGPGGQSPPPNLQKGSPYRRSHRPEAALRGREAWRLRD